MSYFIHDALDFITGHSIELTRKVTDVANNMKGFDHKLSERGETICVAAIVYGENNFQNRKIEDIELSLKSSTNDSVVFKFTADDPDQVKNKTITLTGEPYFNLSYCSLLNSTDINAMKQRLTIAFVMNELQRAGFEFTFKLDGSDPTGPTNQKVLTITAIDKNGAQVILNEIFLKYGVCYYSNLGNNEIGGDTVNATVMREIASDAAKFGRGLAGGQHLLNKLAAEEKRRTSSRDFRVELVKKQNSRVETNKAKEEAFDDPKRNGSMFKIGDTWLEIPPTHVTISQMRNSYTVPLIGMESKAIGTPVNRTIIKLNVIFTGNAVFDDLVRIITQFKYCPINMIRSIDLFKRLSGSQSFLADVYSQLYYIPVTMDQYTLFTVDGHPGTISAVFQFSLFNFSAYVPDNPNGLEYIKQDPSLGLVLECWQKLTKKEFEDNVEIKMGPADPRQRDGMNTTETTWNLEEAAHPYNMIIDERIRSIRENSGNMYPMDDSTVHIWKVDMDRYFNTVYGIPSEEIQVDTKSEMHSFLDMVNSATPLFSEIAHSISVTYSNIFAWQPILGQSQPAAQYIGPGETTVAIDLKGIDMSLVPNDDEERSHDQALMGSVLKTWSEKYGTAEYGFFDDRYLLKTTLLNLIDCNIVSIQNVVSTSVESKPGLFDINILFSKSMFEYNARQNPVSEPDPYFGLRRITSLYAEDEGFQKLSEKAEKVAREGMALIYSKMAKNISVNGQHPALTALMNKFFTDLKNTIEHNSIDWNDGKKEYVRYIVSDKPDKIDIVKSNEAGHGVDLGNNTYRFQAAIEAVTGYAITGLGQFNVIFKPEFKNKFTAGTDYVVGTWYFSKDVNQSLNDVFREGSGIVFVDIKPNSKEIIDAIDHLEISVTRKVTVPKETSITTQEVLDSLQIVMNADSYALNATDGTDLAEQKARYAAYASILKDAEKAQEKDSAVVMYGIAHGMLNDLDKNPDFMEEFKVRFCTLIGRNPQTYDATPNAFTEEDRKKFVRSQYENKKESNNFHLVTGDAVVLELTNPYQKKYNNSLSEISGDSITALTKKMQDKLDTYLSKVGPRYLITNGRWETQKDQPGKPERYYKIIKLTTEGKNEAALDDKGMLDLFRKQNADEIEKVEKNIKEKSFIKPFSAHRYFPMSDGFVGWAQVLSTTVGGWFVAESEESIVNRINRIKDSARTSQPWFRDMRLYDPKSPQAAQLVEAFPGTYSRDAKGNIIENHPPGMLDLIDIQDSELSVAEAIARPKMQRDISAAFSPTKGIKTSVQFVKENHLLFGDDPQINPNSNNKVFNTWTEALNHHDGRERRIDMIDPSDGKGVLEKSRAEWLSKNKELPAIVKERLEINKEGNSILSYNGINRNKKPSVQEAKVNFNTSTVIKMKQVNDASTNSSQLTSDGLVSFGNITGLTHADKEVGINSLGYMYAMNDQTNKWAVHTANINGAYGQAGQGGYMPGSVKYKDGEPVVDDVPEMKGISKSRGDELIAGEELAAEKIVNTLSQNYLDGLLPSHGVQRAFPTYKMYIIKSDTSDYKFSSLDDYWDYRLVQDLMVVRDKNNPTHILRARVVVDPRYITLSPDYRFRTGVEGRLTGDVEINNYQLPVGERDSAADMKRFYKDKAPLRQGMRICIKMGYHTDPRNLDTVFIGTITQLNGGLDTGVYDLAAEGDGRELRVPAVNFSDKFKGDSFNDIINAILRVNPNVIHFGKAYGSFLQRLSYGHKNLANLGMMGMSAAGAFGAGAIGVAVPGGLGAFGAKTLMSFVPKATKVSAKLAWGGGAAVAGTAGAVAAATLGAMGATVAFGQFSEALQWTKPALDELVTRTYMENDFYQSWKGRTHKNWFYGGAQLIPMAGELEGFLKGNIFNAGKQQYQLAKHWYQTYKHGNNPIDDNIFAFDIYNNVIKNCEMNITNKKDIWSVLQDIRRLYPNYALDVRPFGSRSTLFLGPVGWHYWRTDDPVQAILPQLNMSTGIDNGTAQITKGVQAGFDYASLPVNSLGDEIQKVRKECKAGINSGDGIVGQNKGEEGKIKDQLGLVRAPFIPFQRHHLISSDDDIILNGLKPTPERGWNAIVCTYGDDPTKMDPKGVIEFVADTHIYPEFINRKVIHADFTTDAEVATRYALGVLKEGVERLYGGTIIVKGNPRIEPYDKVYISDKINKMFGWVQVETVIHKFDQEMGFTTHIVPNMICEINSNAYHTQSSITRSVLYNKYFKGGAWKGVAVQTAVGAAVAGGITAAGIGLTWPVALGLLVYSGYSTYRGFRNAYESGKDYAKALDKLHGGTESQKDLARWNELYNNPEKALLTEFIGKSWEHEWFIRGAKLGWALGYLHTQDVYTKTWQKLNISDKKAALKEATDSLGKKTSNALGEIKKLLSDTVGKNGAIAKSIESGSVIAEKKKILRDLEKRKFTAANTHNITPENAQAEWDKMWKKLSKARENGLRGEVETILKEMKDFEDKHIRIKTDRLIGSKGGIKAYVGHLQQLGAAEAEQGLFAATADTGKKAWSSVSKGFGAGKKLMTPLMKGGGAAMFLALGLTDFIPDLGYSFAVKAVTKNNVMIVNPIFWRSQPLMPSLDGYMQQDTFMHINDMLVNLNNTMDELKRVTPNWARETFPVLSSKQLKQIIDMERIITTQDSIQADLSKAGEVIKCALEKCGLKGIPKSEISSKIIDKSKMSKASDFTEVDKVNRNAIKWTAIFEAIRAFAPRLSNKGEEDMIPFLLALMWKENNSMNLAPAYAFKTGNHSSFGLCQINITPGGGNESRLVSFGNQIIKPFCPEAQTALANKDWKSLLEPVGVPESTLPYYIRYSIALMVDVALEKKRAANSAEGFNIYTNENFKAKYAKSKYPNLIDAIVIYGLYVGNGFDGQRKFNDWLCNTEECITNNGDIIENFSLKGYSERSPQAAVKGFIPAYKKMVEAFASCKGVESQAQSMGKKEYATQSVRRVSVLDGVKIAHTDMSALAQKIRFAKNCRDSVGTNLPYGSDFANGQGDCSWFVRTVLMSLNLYTTKGQYPNADQLKWVLTLFAAPAANSPTMFARATGPELTIDQAEPGDLVFFKDKSGEVKHVEVYIGLVGGVPTMVGQSSAKEAISERSIYIHKNYGAPIIKSIFRY